MENLENNKLIAEFIDNRTTAENLMFDFSWDWLMPVVEKIELVMLENDNSINVTIGSSLYCTIQDSHMEVIELNTCEPTKILTVYKAVVEFINWYNKNK